MDADEREIYSFLQHFGEEWVNAKEICRRAGGKKRFNEDNNWAKPILQRMKERNVLDGDELGRYRVKPAKKGKGRWVSPDIEKILKEGGVKVDTEQVNSPLDDPLEQL